MNWKHFYVIWFLILIISSCSSVPENHYFTMAYALLPQQQRVQKPFTANLRVRQLEISSAYNVERIVYRYSPYEFRYYNYMLWAVKPQKMITDLLVRHLEHAGLFSDVSLEYGERQPDYEMWGAVHAIEELDSGDEWYAHLAFTIRMSRFREEKVIWAHQVDVKKQVYNKAPVYVIKALSELMEQEMEKITNGLELFLRKQRTKKGDRP